MWIVTHIIKKHGSKYKAAISYVIKGTKHLLPQNCTDFSVCIPRQHDVKYDLFTLAYSYHKSTPGM